MQLGLSGPLFPNKQKTDKHLSLLQSGEVVYLKSKENTTDNVTQLFPSLSLFLIKEEKIKELGMLISFKTELH